MLDNLKIVVIIFLCFASCKGTKINSNCDNEDIERELKIFIEYTKRVNKSNEFIKGNIFNVIKYKDRKRKDIHYSIENDEIYRSDFITVIDNSYNSKGEFPEKELKGFVIIDDNLICFYGDIDFPNMQHTDYINNQKYKSLKRKEMTEDNYQAFSITFKEKDCKLELKKVYMHKTDSLNYISYRQEQL